MSDLIAQGPGEGERWRRELPNASTGLDILIGRSDSDWNVPWDAMISRRHVRLTALADDRFQITRLPSSRNPIFHGGRQVEQATLVPGEHFVIGHTTFTLANRPGASNSPAIGDVTEHAYNAGQLRKRHFRDANTRIGVLSKLPDLISGSTTDEELLVRVTSVLLQATPSASAVAVVSVDEKSDPDDDSACVEVLHYDNRVPGNNGPPISSRLVRSAVSSRESRLHLWSGGRRDAVAFTASEDVDWAFCVPLRSEACPGWALYATGQLFSTADGHPGRSMQAAPDDLGDDVKFAELVGTMLANLRQSLRLERRQSAMRRFFAPVVMEALAKRDVTEVLTPREADLSVLFCDLRGFSKHSEAAGDQLLELLARVSDALGVMTKHILETGGVIGDFHGDAAMGFWGWPLERSENESKVVLESRAAEAALRIWQDYASGASSLGFRCGIGIASGRAVAGRIGTIDQVKVTAFGPVVNLASRLESVSKSFGAEIILDAATADALRTETDFRLRKLATIRPAGMGEAVQISQLIGSRLSENASVGDGSQDSESPTENNQSPDQLSDLDIQHYESALESFDSGNWDDAYRLLHALPPWDRPKDVLLSFILQHNRTPPPGWDGVIELSK